MIMNSLQINKKLLVVFCFILIFIAVPCLLAEGESASLYLSPYQGTFFIGTTFDISVFVNTEGNSINAVQVDLEFSPDLLQVTSPTAGSSFISVWADQPFYSNKQGIISFKGGVPSPGIKTSAGLVSTISFRVKAPGIATISFSDSSKVLLADGKGTNILKNTAIGNYTLIISPPEGPELFSPTHPSLTTWYKNNNPSFFWHTEPGVTDFSYSLDQDPQGIPDNISEGEENSVTFNDVKNGIWYFHIKAKKGGVFGGTTHYPLHIDTVSPQEFKIDIETIGGVTGSRFFAYFSTDDLLSGIDYYEVSIVDLSDSASEANPFFIEVVSPHRIPFEKAGKYAIIAMAYDKAGNYTEAKTTLNIVNSFIFYDSKGLRIKDLFFPWWLAYIILLIGVVLGILIYQRKQKKNLAVRLRKEVKQAEKEIEDVKKLEEKIQKMKSEEKKEVEEAERLARKLRSEESPPEKKIENVEKPEEKIHEMKPEKEKEAEKLEILARKLRGEESPFNNDQSNKGI